MHVQVKSCCAEQWRGGSARAIRDIDGTIGFHLDNSTMNDTIVVIPFPFPFCVGCKCEHRNVVSVVGHFSSSR